MSFHDVEWFYNWSWDTKLRLYPLRIASGAKKVKGETE